jgi:hypothetical protein
MAEDRVVFIDSINIVVKLEPLLYRGDIGGQEKAFRERVGNQVMEILAAVEPFKREQGPPVKVGKVKA